MSKNGAAFEQKNYRGIHLTTILSKVAEKIIGLHLISIFEYRTFGEIQWTFRNGLSARVLITMFMMSWILATCTGKKIGDYLSGITGAFDRVYKSYLLAKLQGFGISPKFLYCLDTCTSSYMNFFGFIHFSFLSISTNFSVVSGGSMDFLHLIFHVEMLFQHLII